MNRHLDPEVLNVGERRLSEDRAESALERALTRTDRASGVLEREVGQVAPRPLLEALDERIGVGEVVRHRVRDLRGARVEHEVPRGGVRERRAPLADEPKGQIDVRERRARGHDARRLDDHP